jgi:hypothetical protein
MRLFSALGCAFLLGLPLEARSAEPEPFCSELKKVLNEAEAGFKGIQGETTIAPGGRKMIVPTVRLSGAGTCEVMPGDYICIMSESPDLDTIRESYQQWRTKVSVCLGAGWTEKAWYPKRVDEAFSGFSMFKSDKKGEARMVFVTASRSASAKTRTDHGSVGIEVKHQQRPRPEPCQD